MVKRTTQRRSREEWREIIAGQKESGKTVSAFCRQENLSVKSFYGWRNRLCLTPGRKGEEFIQISPAGSNAVDYLRIQTPGGYSLEMAPGTEPEYVRSLLTVVAGLR